MPAIQRWGLQAFSSSPRPKRLMATPSHSHSMLAQCRFASRSDSLFGEMTQRDPEFGAQLDPGMVARLTGLSVDDLHAAAPPQVVSTGTAFAIVALRSHEALARLKVEQEEATKYLRENGGRWFYVLGPTGNDDPAWRARMQFYGGEDPATGSAAGCAISYLVGHGIVAPRQRIHVQQGVEIGRTSDLFLAADLVSGKVGRCAGWGQHCSRCKGAAFPAVIHTLSTEFNQGKLLSMFILAVFPLLQDSFHAEFRFLFSLFRGFRAPYSCPSIERNSSRKLFRIS